MKMAYKSLDSGNDAAYSDPSSCCRVCGRITLNRMLMNFGARCEPCYESYLRQGVPASNTPMSPARKAEIAKSLSSLSLAAGVNLEWAQALRIREESGERLSMVQKQLWREALQGREVAA